MLLPFPGRVSFSAVPLSPHKRSTFWRFQIPDFIHAIQMVGVLEQRFNGLLDIRNIRHPVKLYYRNGLFTIDFYHCNYSSTQHKAF
jgi:hypothetical protein